MSINSAEVLTIIHSNYPGLQDELLTYVESILIENADTFESVEEIKESIEGILNEVDSSKTDDEINSICRDLFNILVISQGGQNQPVLLDNPISINDLMLENKSTYDVKSNKLNNIDAINAYDEDQINRNMMKVEESRNKKQKKVEELPTLHVSQQFNRNTSYDNTESAALTNFTIENFDMSFASSVLLKEATITIGIGRRYGLIGRNGLGKSTLLKAINNGDLKLPSCISVYLVEQEVVGDDTSALDSVLSADTVRSNLLKELERINKQDNCNKQGSDDLLKLYTKLEEIEADKAPTRAAIILKGLGFNTEMQLRSTKAFSGGWRMRLSLAQALFSQPDLLLLDEPTNMLDMKATIWLEEYLKTWKRSLIVISHDQKFLDAACTDILFLHNLKIEHYKCNFSSFEVARKNKLIAQQKEYETQKEEREHIQRFIDRFRTYANRAALVQSKIKMLERMTVIEAPEKEKDVIMEFPACGTLSSPLIQLNDVKFGYNSSRTIIDFKEISVSSHSRICIVGENGAGKTTLLKLLIGELEPQEGFIKCHKNLRIGFFSQHHVDQLNLNQTSLEFLQTKFSGYESQYYRNRLGKFGITGEVGMRPIQSLSGGQKSRVAFTILSMKNPNFLILDEPTNHLDMQTISALATAINKFEGGVILVSHDERLINEVCTELWLVENTGNVSVVEGGISKYREMLIKELESY